MPVIFGDNTNLTGAGEWDYPHAGIVIGVVIEVVSPGPAPRTWGSEIIRYRDLGVFAPITEAGRMHAQPVFNDSEVNYEIGHGPVGIAYDLDEGVTINVMEILNETPPSGGGGGGVDPGVGSCYAFGPFTIAGSGGTGSITWDWKQSWSPWTFTSSGLTVPLDGIYLISCKGHLHRTSGTPNSIHWAAEWNGTPVPPSGEFAWASGVDDMDIEAVGVALPGHNPLSAGDVVGLGIGLDNSATVTIQDIDLTVVYLSTGST